MEVLKVRFYSDKLLTLETISKLKKKILNSIENKSIIIVCWILANNPPCINSQCQHPNIFIISVASSRIRF
jgi:hypothetical protein